MINFSIIAKDKIYLHFLKKNPKDLKKTLIIHLKPKGKGEQG